MRMSLGDGRLHGAEEHRLGAGLAPPGRRARLPARSGRRRRGGRRRRAACRSCRRSGGWARSRRRRTRRPWAPARRRTARRCALGAPSAGSLGHAERGAAQLATVALMGDSASQASHTSPSVIVGPSSGESYPIADARQRTACRTKPDGSCCRGASARAPSSAHSSGCGDGGEHGGAALEPIAGVERALDAAPPAARAAAARSSAPRRRRSSAARRTARVPSPSAAARSSTSLVARGQPGDAGAHRGVGVRGQRAHRRERRAATAPSGRFVAARRARSSSARRRRSRWRASASLSAAATASTSGMLSIGGGGWRRPCAGVAASRPSVASVARSVEAVVAALGRRQRAQRLESPSASARRAAPPRA